MPMQQVEFEFPDPDKKDGKEVEVDIADEAEFELEIDEAVGREEVGKPKKEVREEIEVEVVDDTPEKDRGKTPSDFKEVDEDELDSYSKTVKKRIGQLNKAIHDERRAKETAERAREEAITYAGQLVEDNKKLKGNVDSSHNSLIQSAKKQVESEMVLAKKQYKEAYDSGETDSIVDAQQVLNAAQIRMDKVDRLQPRVRGEVKGTLQRPQNAVQSPVQQTQAPIQRDEKAEVWREGNPWFGADDEMTAFA